MVICIAAVGKVREAHFRAGIELYAARIRHWLPLELHEIKEGTGEDSNGKGTAALAREAASFEKLLEKGGRTVALTPEGRLLTTEQFAAWIVSAMGESVPRLQFLIGGAWGLAPKLIQRADLALSLSPLTFAHELAQVMLLEQIYRALSIWKGHPYHKA